MGDYDKVNPADIRIWEGGEDDPNVPWEKFEEVERIQEEGLTEGQEVYSTPVVMEDPSAGTGQNAGYEAMAEGSGLDPNKGYKEPEQPAPVDPADGQVRQ